METEELLCIKNLNIDDNIELDIYEGFPWTDFDFHHNLATVWSVLIVSFVNGGCLGDFFLVKTVKSPGELSLDCTEASWREKYYFFHWKKYLSKVLIDN